MRTTLRPHHLQRNGYPGLAPPSPLAASFCLVEAVGGGYLECRRRSRFRPLLLFLHSSYWGLSTISRLLPMFRGLSRLGSRRIRSVPGFAAKSRWAFLGVVLSNTRNRQRCTDFCRCYTTRGSSPFSQSVPLSRSSNPTSTFVSSHFKVRNAVLVECRLMKT